MKLTDLNNKPQYFTNFVNQRPRKHEIGLKDDSGSLKYSFCFYFPFYFFFFVWIPFLRYFAIVFFFASHFFGPKKNAKNIQKIKKRSNMGCFNASVRLSTARYYGV